MSLRIRRARTTDFPHALTLADPDRPLFSESLWRRLPWLLIDLIQRDRILLCVVEETHPPEIRFLGASAFLNPEVREQVVHCYDKSALSVAFTRPRDRG